MIHENIKPKHADVVLLGRDKSGCKVTLDRDDNFRLRAYGDRYLEREHRIECIFDKEIERFAHDRGLNVIFDKEQGGKVYKLLISQTQKKNHAGPG